MFFNTWRLVKSAFGMKMQVVLIKCRSYSRVICILDKRSYFDPLATGKYKSWNEEFLSFGFLQSSPGIVETHQS